MTDTYTDTHREEIYAVADAALRNGQHAFHVHMFPFRMSPEKIDQYRDSTWHAFWLELKVGYDVFEQYGRSPIVGVRNSRYVATRPSS